MVIEIGRRMHFIEGMKFMVEVEKVEKVEKVEA